MNVFWRTREDCGNERDSGELVDAPDSKSFTAMNGTFEVSAQNSNFPNYSNFPAAQFHSWTLKSDVAKPIIRIAHDCNDGTKVCKLALFTR